MATKQTSTGRDVLRFWVPVLLLIALIPVVPWAASEALGLDERTPLAIAEDTLHEKYGLELVDAAGQVLSSDAVELTVSEFDMEAGATTEDVPFSQDGKAVRCTVRVPSDGDPREVTAECRPADAEA